MMKRSIAALALTLSSAASAQATSFDLTCRAAYSKFGTGKVEKGTGDTGPYFKVDLSAGRFCQGNCTETRPIFRVSPTEIFFEWQKEPITVFFRVNRESGDYLSIIGDDPQMKSVESGTCTASAFTGFPKRKF